MTKQTRLTMSENLAVLSGKLSTSAIRTLKIGLGSNLPGKIARRLAPTVLTRLALQATKGVLAVSGTNGKSTTCGFISSILDKAGYKIVHNRQGANLITGITASLVDEADWQGNIEADYCLFEIDEATLPLVAKEIPISLVVVTNLFRDQLDRFGELDTTARLIKDGIAVNNSPAILNADDPNVAQLSASQCLFYGIESVQSETQAAKGQSELSYCVKCGSEYTYTKVFYGQLGHYLCQKCDNKRPEPEISAHNVELFSSSSKFVLKAYEKQTGIVLSLPGMFNVYNALAAAAIACKLGVGLDVIKLGLETYVTLFGRSERICISGKQVLIQLIKNPSGATQVISACANDPNKQVFIGINDNYADGRDISWLWDAEFERLADYDGNVVVAGERAQDMAVRMKYAGIAKEKIIAIANLSEALDRALNQTKEGETLWVMPTYTCLLELQKILASRGLSLSGT